MNTSRARPTLPFKFKQITQYSKPEPPSDVFDKSLTINRVSQPSGRRGSVKAPTDNAKLSLSSPTLLVTHKKRIIRMKIPCDKAMPQRLRFSNLLSASKAPEL